MGIDSKNNQPQSQIWWPSNKTKSRGHRQGERIHYDEFLNLAIKKKVVSTDLAIVSPPPANLLQDLQQNCCWKGANNIPRDGGETGEMVWHLLPPLRSFRADLPLSVVRHQWLDAWTVLQIWACCLFWFNFLPYKGAKGDEGRKKNFQAQEGKSCRRANFWIVWSLIKRTWVCG